MPEALELGLEHSNPGPLEKQQLLSVFRSRWMLGLNLARAFMCARCEH